ncbi:MAG: TatD family hydrolase [Bacilli bacterium]
MNLFDTHVHLNAEHYEQDLEEVLQRAKNAGVYRMVVVGFDEQTINKAIQLAESYEALYAAVGWHPVDAIDCTEQSLQKIEDLMQHPKVVALGEIGLDYYWDKSPKEVQQQLFRKQIQLAKKVNKPIIIHNRDATADVLTILKEENAETVGGIMHCFSGSKEVAEQCMAMNFYISFGGPVTFKNAVNVHESAAAVPLSRLLIETDCPYLTPHPYRGKRNEPSYVTFVAEALAKLHDISVEQLVEQTTKNANALFRIEG